MSGIARSLLQNERRRLMVALVVSVLVHIGIFLVVAAAPDAETARPPDSTRIAVSVRIRETEPATDEQPEAMEEASSTAGTAQTEPATPAETPTSTEPTAPDDVKSAEPPSSTPSSSPPEIPLLTAPAQSSAREIERASPPRPEPRPGESDSSQTVYATSGSPLTPPIPAPTVVEPYPINPIVPTYPISARRRGIEGEVVIRVIVSARGTPIRTEIVQPAADRRLNSAAIAAVEAAVFEPGTVNAEPSDMPLHVRIVFQLTPETGA